MYLKSFLFFYSLLLLANPVSSQILLNGGFSSGTANWGCGVEVNSESTYGGSSSNVVVEVDAGAGLCQTMNGLIIGNAYLVSFSSSRRTGGCPSPVITNINVNVSGGALSTTITRTNTTFGFSSDYFIFIANATTHTLTFSAGSGFGGSTCGMIMDNFVVTFSPLPVELLNFEAKYSAGVIEFNWSTASEKNNSYFSIQKSNNGIDFTDLATVPSKAPQGNSTSKLNYTSTNYSSHASLIYYRLKQVDLDQTFSYSNIIVVNTTAPKNKLYPNPNTGEFWISVKSKGQIRVSILNHLEELVYSESGMINSESEPLNIKTDGKLSAGYYHCLVTTAYTSDYFPLIIH